MAVRRGLGHAGQERCAAVGCLRGTDGGRLRIGVRDARHGFVVCRVALSGDVRRHNVSLVLADVCQGPDPVDIPNGPNVEAIGHLLEQPAVAVGVFERGEGVVALLIRIRPVDPITRLLGVELRSGRSGMKHPTDRGSPTDKFVAPRFDVRHDQVQAVGRSGVAPP